MRLGTALLAAGTLLGCRAADGADAGPPEGSPAPVEAPSAAERVEIRVAEPRGFPGLGVLVSEVRVEGPVRRWAIVAWRDLDGDLQLDDDEPVPDRSHGTLASPGWFRTGPLGWSDAEALVLLVEAESAEGHWTACAWRLDPILELEPPTEPVLLTREE